MLKELPLIKKQLKKTSTSIWLGILSFTIITAMFATTAYAWMSDSISSKGAVIKAGSYSAGVFAVKDWEKPNDDENILAKTDHEGVKWLNSMSISLPDDAFNSGNEYLFYLEISPFGSNTIDFKYNAQIVVENDDYTLTIEKNGSPSGAPAQQEMKNALVTPTSETDIYKITVTSKNPVGPISEETSVDDIVPAPIANEAVKLTFSMQMANVNQELVAVDSVENFATNKGNSLLYLTKDIIASDKALLLEKLGTINLNGHTLQVKSFKVKSDEYGIVTISNGSLVVNGEQVIDKSKITLADGSKTVAINLDNLTGMPPPPIEEIVPTN